MVKRDYRYSDVIHCKTKKRSRIGLVSDAYNLELDRNPHMIEIGLMPRVVFANGRPVCTWVVGNR